MSAGDVAGTLCTNQGRCESECRSDRDCPRGAFCASSCGVCFYANLSLATCFASTLEDDRVRGACRGSALSDGALRAVADTQPDGSVLACLRGRIGDALIGPDGAARTDAADGEGGLDVTDVADANDAGDASDASDVNDVNEVKDAADLSDAHEVKDAADADDVTDASAPDATKDGGI